MSEKSSMITNSNTGLTLSGNLTFSNVSVVLKEGSALLENHHADSIEINLLNIDKIDTAGITLLLAWKRLCASKNKAFTIKDAPQQAVSLITTNKMDKVLNIR